MDKVRFGRALGYGARHAAKSLMAAADAATSPEPARPSGTPGPGAAGRAASPGTPRAAAAVTPRATTQNAARVVNAGRKATKGVLAPVRKATSVVWLQVTGSFFALLAFGIGRGLWKVRDGYHATAFTGPWIEVWVLTAMTAVLVYFCLSNFVRAAIRDRQ